MIPHPLLIWAHWARLRAPRAHLCPQKVQARDPSCSISLASALPPHEIGWCESFQRNESTVRADKNPTVIPRPNTAPVGSPGRQHLAWLIGEQTTSYGIQTGLYLRAKLKLNIQTLIIIWKWWPTQQSRDKQGVVAEVKIVSPGLHENVPPFLYFSNGITKTDELGELRGWSDLISTKHLEQGSGPQQASCKDVLLWSIVFF